MSHKFHTSKVLRIIHEGEHLYTAANDKTVKVTNLTDLVSQTFEIPFQISNFSIDERYMHVIGVSGLRIYDKITKSLLFNTIFMHHISTPMFAQNNKKILGT